MTKANLYKAIYRNWKLALTRIPDPNRPTTWDLLSFTFTGLWHFSLVAFFRGILSGDILS